MDLPQLLLQLGLGISSNAIYDFIKKNSFNSLENAISELNSGLNIGDINISGQIINFLAKNGDIRIVKTNIYGENNITMTSSPGTKLSFGNSSTSKTKKTSIEVGEGAIIEIQDGAYIKQNDDGSINFFA